MAEDLVAEREAWARLVAELAVGRSLEVQLFAAELAGRVRARSVRVTTDRLAIAEAAKILGVCRGKIGQLVGEGLLPELDDAGTFSRSEIEGIALWIRARVTRDQFERIALLREKQKPGAGPG